MVDADLLVSGIDFKIRRLIEKLNTLKEEKKSLDNKNKELNKQITENKQLINNLKEQNEILKITKSLEIVEGKNITKKKLNELVREIDNCIALLNQ